jgi:NAD(P)-dependent dehydrogenase (short-subunit alcohol dehydrogenase family)
MDRPLDGRAVVVTGGGRGLGRAYCLELARLGASVVVNDLGAGLGGETEDVDPATEVVREIEAAGGRAIVDPGSVSSDADAKRMVDAAVEAFGRFDAVVNNAGITRDRMLFSMSEEDFDDVVAVHLKGTFNLMRHAAIHWRAMVKRGEEVSGRIVNTTSSSGLRGNVGQVNYGGAKAGIAGMTRIAAAELARYGVTANAITPVARTRMTVAAGVEADAPAGFDPMAPDNAAPLVAYLVSAESGWLTGQVLRADGATVGVYAPWRLEDEKFVSEGGERPEYGELDGGLRRLYGVLPALAGQAGRS